MRLLILGLGYSARHALPLLRPAFATVAGTTRRPERAERLAALGVVPHVLGDGFSEDLAADIARASHILVSAGPGAAGDPFLGPYAEALRAAAASGGLKAIVYLSTIGVYGDSGGGWVDEATEIGEGAGRARGRLAAERGWLALGSAHGVPVSILRLGGIYGPGRNAFVNLDRGTARRIIRAGQVFNRIHVADIGQVIARALTRAASGIFNVTDGDPTPAEEPISFAAALMGMAPPPEVPFDAAEFTPMARTFWEDNRRVRSRRIVETLDVVLKYPTYREGLTALWRDGTWGGDADDRAEASPRFRSG